MMDKSTHSDFEPLELSTDKDRLLAAKRRTSVPAFVYVCALLACMSSLNTGYDIGIIATAIIYLEEDLGITSSQIEIMVSFANLFAIVGSICSGQLAHRFGRKKIIMTSAIVSCVAVLLMATTSSFYVIVLSRAMNGISIGMSLTVTPMYIAEIAPARIRGKVVIYGEIFVNIGHVLGYIMAYVCWYYNVQVSLAWRIMVGSGSIISGVLFISMLFMPESPRWLSQSGYDIEARAVIASTTRSESDADRILFGMNESNKTLDNAIGWKEIIFPCIFKPDIALRKALVVAVPVAMFQQLVGIEVWVYYVPKILQDNGVRDELVFLGTICVGFSKLFTVAISQCCIDRQGRRSLLLMSSVSMMLFIGALGVVVQFEDEIPNANVYILGLLVIVVGTFSLGWGPVPWILISEMFALNVRAKAAGYCTLLNRLCAFFTTLTFFTLQEAITQYGVYYMYFGLTALIAIFVYVKVPETKSKTLEEITKMLIGSRA